MSQQEFERNDQEVMNLVNRAASPESMAVAEEIAQEVGKTVPSGKAKTDADSKEADLFVEELHWKWRRRQMVCGGICVVAFILAAVMLVIVLENPAILSWFVYAAILLCGIVAGYQIEKLLRLMR